MLKLFYLYFQIFYVYRLPTQDTSISPAVMAFMRGPTFSFSTSNQLTIYQQDCIGTDKLKNEVL